VNINIKGKELGKGRPFVCVPIVEQEREDIVRAAESLKKKPADMIEWRIDWYCNSASIRRSMRHRFHPVRNSNRQDSSVYLPQ